MPLRPDFRGTSKDSGTFPNPLEGQDRLRRAQNRHLLEHFSPSVRRSAEDIVNKFRTGAGRDRGGHLGEDMFFNDCFLTPEAMFTKADEGGDDPTLRGRHPHHPHFRVPSWLSDDQDMKDLAARMSHAPHFATLGRRGGAGPWRERRHSGGSAMSGTSEDDAFDPTGGGDRMSQGSSGSCEQPGVPHEIPIRFEAPPPPSQQQQPPAGPPAQGQPQDSEGCMNNKPTRTTSAVDATEYGSNGGLMNNRNSRCASAPPEMAEQQQQGQQGQPQDPAQNQQPQRFVSKINITPQAPTVPQPSTSPQYSPLPAKFNTVPRPFVSPDPQQQYQQPQQQYQQPQQQYQQPQQQYQQQYPQQYPQLPPQHQQQPPLGFFPPPQPDQQWQFGGQQQYPPQQFPQQETQRSGQRPSVVRNIPIFVEGRDDSDQDTRPAAPPQWTQTRPQPQQPQPPPPQQQFQQPPQPQPMPRQKRQQAHQPTPPPQQPIPHPVPMPMPEPHGIPPSQHQASPQQPPPQEHAPTPEPQQSAPKDPRMAQIDRVSKTVKDFAGQVEKFKGGEKNREFLYLDEMLTRALLELDNVDPDGCDEVRQARRAVIKEINAAIAKLEEKAKAPQKENTKPEQEVNMETPTPAPATPTPTQDSAVPPPTTPTPAPTPAPAEGGEKAEEKMETDQQEEVKSSELAEGTAEPAPAQPPVSSS